MLSPNYIDCEQGSREWFEARLGCVTSSRIGDLVKKRQKGKNKNDGSDDLQCKIDLRWELVGEFLTGKPTEHYVSRWMKEGKEKEPLARTEYEIRNNVTVETIGFCYHPAIKYAGASPDGLVGVDGLVEFKCPKLHTHLEYLDNDVIPDEYLPQLVWQLACDPDRQWVDFVSFHPDMQEEDRIFQKRMMRSEAADALISAYQAEVEQFNSEVQAKIANIKSKRLVAA